MPVYLHVFNLIVSKKTIAEKYLGGIEQFRLDYSLSTSEINQEDDDVFSLGQMNPDAYDIESLMKKGLDYDNETQQSSDFTILCRYDDFLWETNLVKHNRVFAWHIDSSKDLIQRVEEISNMPVQYIYEQMQKGNNLYSTIRS
jgi:hypothetical protein